MHLLRSLDRNSRVSTLLFGVSCVLAVLFIILFPDRIFQSSLKGLEIWWKIVFPALLPFFILTDLLAGYGMFHSLGKLFRPFMRLFRLPGEAGWAVACGMTAGFPAGAHATAELKKRGIVTLHEGERLLALSHFCSPILLMHIVAIGFFQDVQLGWMLIIIHVISLIVTGLLLRGRADDQISMTNQSKANRKPNDSQHETSEDVDPIAAGLGRTNEGFGKKLGDAVMSAIQKLMGIGGIMIVFSVIVELIQILLHHVPFQQTIVPIFTSVGLTDGMAKTALSSLLEVHLGAFQFSEQIMLPQLFQTALLSSLFAWSGLSSHLQALSIARNTGIRYRSFMFARLVHAAIAFITAVVLWNPLHHFLPRTIPGSSPLAPAPIPGSTFSFWVSGWSTLLIIFTAAIVGIVSLSLIFRIVKKG